LAGVDQGSDVRATGGGRAVRFGRALRVAGLLAALLGGMISRASGASAPAPSPAPARYREGRVLIQPKPGLEGGAIEDWHRDRRSRVIRTFPEMGGCQVVELAAGGSVAEQIEAYRASGLVEWAEPDYLLRPCRVPSDPAFANGSQWHLENTGQAGGLAGADIAAAAGWDTLAEAPEVVVAVVDSGVRTTHEDLADNLWRNPGEIAGNGLDDDRNGYVDDVFGIDAAAETGDPSDELGHGTHVAGILGAVGDNGVGGAGVAWRVRIMACKFITASGEGATSDAIQGLDYARVKGAKVVNCSWGGSPSSTALRRAFQRLRDAGILVTVAAGNDGADLDAQPQYPAAYGFENMVTVVATTATDGLAEFSNFGATIAELGAPGVSIPSTWFTSDRAYSSQTGSSMAAPVVAGMLALMRARFASETPAQLVARLLAATDPLPALAGKCVSGGRANLARALRDGATLTLRFARGAYGGLVVEVTGTPGTTCRLESSGDLQTWETETEVTLPAEGVVTYDGLATGASARFVRARSVP
jgi:subtilisin family serine protease